MIKFDKFIESIVDFMTNIANDHYWCLFDIINGGIFLHKLS